MRILQIEDDSATAQSIELMLKADGLNVYTTDLGEEGIDLGKIYDYDLILLDLNLPDMSGIDVLRSLRVGKINTPIMILTGTSAIDTKVKCFTSGADDYMTKPFHKDELVARIYAIVRRSKGHAQSTVVTGNLAVNLDAKTAEVDGKRLHLTGKEYQMLELLSLRKGTTLTKEMFLNHLYGGMDEPELKIIDVFICKLRKKVRAANSGADYIETVWGRGYVMRDPQETDDAAPTNDDVVLGTGLQGMSHLCTRVYDLVSQGTSLTFKEIMAGVGGTPDNEPSIRGVIGRLVAQDLFRNVGRPKAALYTRTAHAPASLAA